MGNTITVETMLTWIVTTVLGIAGTLIGGVLLARVKRIDDTLVKLDERDRLTGERLARLEALQSPPNA